VVAAEGLTSNLPIAVTLPVGGMTCAACQHHVERALRGQPGVLDVARSTW
jgi:cation transport ATPase